MQAKVEEYNIARFAVERVRNGSHHSRQVLTSAGAVEVTAPRVNDRRIDPDTGERACFLFGDLAAVVP